jgi:hypothetical protein
MASLTFNTKEAIDNLLVMIEHGIVVLQAKVDCAKIYEARVDAYHKERSKRSFFVKMWDDWCDDESDAGLQMQKDRIELYRIGHTCKPELHQLKNLQRLLKTNPSVVTMGDSDMSLILSTNADFEKHFKDNVEDSNNALNS